MLLEKPLGYFGNAVGSPLSFHLLSVDEGLMALVVFPDDTTMMFDCNVRQEHADEVLAYLAAHIPVRLDPETKGKERWIDVFVNSHRDLDHYRGLSYVHEAFPVKSIWDSGQTGATTQDEDYQYYMGLRRALKDKYGSRALVVPVPSLSPLVSYGGADVYCICSSKDFATGRFYESAAEEVYEERAAKIQHTNCIALVIRYGGRSILLSGDTDWKAWKEKVVPNFSESGLLRSNIFVASHHGSRSFFTDEQENDSIDPFFNSDTTYVDSIDHIKPSITLISCGNYESAHHPNEDALDIYKDKTAYGQVYTTFNTGVFAGFIDTDGNWTVAPARFKPASNCIGPSFDIRCVSGWSDDPIPSGSNFQLGSSLRFSVVPQGGLLDSDDDVRIWWEVSNGGVNNDHERQDIHFKDVIELCGKYEFERRVEYEGTHLLRCQIINARKGHDVTRIYVVNGVK